MIWNRGDWSGWSGRDRIVAYRSQRERNGWNGGAWKLKERTALERLDWIGRDRTGSKRSGEDWKGRKGEVGTGDQRIGLDGIGMDRNAFSTDSQRLDSYFRSLYEHSRERMPRNLKTPEAAAILEEFEENISVLVDRYALRLATPAGTQATLLHEPIGEKTI